MKRSGFSLIEVLMVMIVIGMLMTLSVGLLSGTLDTHAADAALSKRLSTLNAIADQFRQDVASASAAPGRLNDDVAFAKCLILRRPDRSVVVYHSANGVLERVETAADKAPKTTILLRNELVQLDFARSEPEGGLITLRYAETNERFKDAVRNVQEFSAPLGGDLK